MQVSDLFLARARDTTYTILSEKIGKGSYGTIHIARDEKKNRTAVKCCAIGPDIGIPNLVETTIMSTIVHPYLNRAIRIFASSETLYIFQELAKYDLAALTLRTRRNYQPTPRELQDWSHRLVQAVAVLHKEGYIHGDVKASNVFMFYDNSIRLADFSMSCCRPAPGKLLHHVVCTPTHRPLECFLKQGWNEAVDVWSLGCTLYELAYGQNLFAYQPSTYKEATRERAINALIDWARRGPFATLESSEITELVPFELEFTPFHLSLDFDREEMQLFNDLLSHMLVVTLSKRWSIEQVLGHPYFDSLVSVGYQTVHRPLRQLEIQEHARVLRYLQRSHENEEVRKVAFQIYCACSDLDDISEQLRATGCTWIAHKLLFDVPCDVKLSYAQVIELERIICHNLSFRLR